MARKPTAKKITRRDAVALLGVGAVVGAALPEPVGARQGPKQECAGEAPVDRYGQPTRRYLLADTCCDESRNAILVGVEEKNFKPTKNGKLHLKKLREALVEEKLAEYCLMIWGLTMPQVQQLRKQLPADLRLGDRDPEKK